MSRYKGGSKKGGVDWGAYDDMADLIDEYMPACGEGDSKASQVCTAVNKLVYKWYNDGDVYDNTHAMSGWCNNLSSFANWLHKYTDAAGILDGIETVKTDAEYEHLLWDLTTYLINKDKLVELDGMPVEGTIYKCEGPFAFEN